MIVINNKQKHMKRVTLVLLINILFFTISFAQTSYNIDEGSEMTITGTSTFHDWTSKVNEIKGEYIFKEDIRNKKLPKTGGSILDQVKMLIPVLSIESPRGSTMDKKTFNALKYEEHPDIIFELKDDVIEKIIDKNAKTFLLKIKGDLTAAGYTKEINVSLEVQKLDTEQLKVKGSYPLDMVEYEIEPPSAMFGQLKTGKDVTIDFELLLSAK
jgi:polyisoprenoid-binding protein YceI